MQHVIIQINLRAVFVVSPSSMTFSIYKAVVSGQSSDRGMRNRLRNSERGSYGTVDVHWPQRIIKIENYERRKCSTFVGMF